MREDVAMTSAHDLLEAYDRQLRREGEVGRANEVVELGPLLLATFDHGGFVTYASLEGHDVDTLVSGAIVHFRDRTEVASFEWKTRGHDWPDDLGERLVAHALVAELAETVMIGEASALADDGVSLCLGTDSNARIAMVEEMRWLEYGQRLRAGRRGIVLDASGRCGSALLDAATSGGAEALGTEGKILQVAAEFRAGLGCGQGHDHRSDGGACEESEKGGSVG